MRGSARTPSVMGLNTPVRFGRGAASFLAFPISLDKVGIRKAAVLPDPASLKCCVSYARFTRHFHVLLTCLSNSNDVMSCEDRWQAIGLDGGWHFVSTEVDVLQHDRVESSILELRGSVSKMPSVGREGGMHTFLTG